MGGPARRLAGGSGSQGTVQTRGILGRSSLADKYGKDLGLSHPPSWQNLRHNSAENSGTNYGNKTAAVDLTGKGKNILVEDVPPIQSPQPYIIPPIRNPTLNHEAQLIIYTPPPNLSPIMNW